MKNSIIWVQGMEAAKSYPMMPSSNAILMDQESERFFIKTCDNVGMCSIRSFKYQEEKPTTSDYVTREELKTMLKELLDEQPISTVESESE